MKKYGFTIMEVMIAIIMLSLLAAFSLPNYTRSIEKNAERSAIMQLNTIYAAAQLWYNSERVYPDSGGTADETWINSNLDLNLIERDVQFTYVSAGGSTFTADATFPSGKIIRITELPLSSSNPCCESGACLNLVSSCP